jgi:hypothetical protein
MNIIGIFLVNSFELLMCKIGVALLLTLATDQMEASQWRDPSHLLMILDWHSLIPENHRGIIDYQWNRRSPGSLPFLLRCLCAAKRKTELYNCPFDPRELKGATSLLHDTKTDLSMFEITFDNSVRIIRILYSTFFDCK